MKAIRLCATLAAALLSLTPVLRAQTYSLPPGQMLAIGDTNTATAYVVSRLWELNIVIWGLGTNGSQVIAGWVDDRNLQFDSIQSLSTYYLNRMQFALHQAMTNQNPKIDLSQPCTTFPSMVNDVYLGATYGYLFNYSTFSYPTDARGNYTCPSATAFPMKLSTVIAYVIPGIKWAIWETFYRTNGARVCLWDSRTNSVWNNYGPGTYDTNGGVNTNYNWLILKTAYICDNVTYSNKIELATTNGYSVIGTDGFTVPETPVILSPPNRTNGQFVVSYSGGDPGRVLTLMSSEDLIHWTPSSSSTNGYSQTSVKRLTVIPAGSDRQFYRVLLGN